MHRNATQRTNLPSITSPPCIFGDETCPDRRTERDKMAATATAAAEDFHSMVLDRVSRLAISSSSSSSAATAPATLGGKNAEAPTTFSNFGIEAPTSSNAGMEAVAPTCTTATTARTGHGSNSTTPARGGRPGGGGDDADLPPVVRSPGSSGSDGSVGLSPPSLPIAEVSFAEDGVSDFSAKVADASANVTEAWTPPPRPSPKYASSRRPGAPPMPPRTGHKRDRRGCHPPPPSTPTPRPISARPDGRDERGATAAATLRLLPGLTPPLLVPRAASSNDCTPRASGGGGGASPSEEGGDYARPRKRRATHRRGSGVLCGPSSSSDPSAALLGASARPDGVRRAESSPFPDAGAAMMERRRGRPPAATRSSSVGAAATPMTLSQSLTPGAPPDISFDRSDRRIRLSPLFGAHRLVPPPPSLGRSVYDDRLARLAGEDRLCGDGAAVTEEEEEGGGSGSSSSECSPRLTQMSMILPFAPSFRVGTGDDAAAAARGGRSRADRRGGGTASRARLRMRRGFGFGGGGGGGAGDVVASKPAPRPRARTVSASSSSSAASPSSSYSPFSSSSDRSAGRPPRAATRVGERDAPDDDNEAEDFPLMPCLSSSSDAVVDAAADCLAVPMF